MYTYDMYIHTHMHFMCKGSGAAKQCAWLSGATTRRGTRPGGVKLLASHKFSLVHASSLVYVINVSYS